MNARYLRNLAILSATAFGVLKLIGFVIWVIFGEGNQLRISVDLIMFAGLVSVSLGVLLGALFKAVQVAQSDENVKSVGIGAAGLCVLTGVCSTGACAIPLLLSTLASLVLFIPVAIGIKLSALLKPFKIGPEPGALE